MSSKAVELVPYQSNHLQLAPQNFTSLTRDQKDEILLRMSVGNQEENRELSNRVKDLTSHLGEAQKEIGTLQKTVQSQRQILDSHAAKQNIEDLARLQSKSKCIFCVDKELIWKTRVMEAVIKVNVSASSDAIDKAVETNKKTRQELRKYLNQSSRDYKATLVEYGRLLLKANPLITWNVLQSALNSALQKFSQPIMHREGYGYVRLEPHKAANLLFNNPNVSSSDLWSYYESDPDRTSSDFIVPTESSDM